MTATVLISALLNLTAAAGLANLAFRANSEVYTHKYVCLYAGSRKNPGAMPKRLYKVTKPYLGCTVTMEEAVGALSAHVNHTEVITHKKAWKLAHKVFGRNEISVARIVAFFKRQRASTMQQGDDRRSDHDGYDASSEEQEEEEEDARAELCPMLNNNDVVYLEADPGDLATVEVKSRNRRRLEQRPVYVMEVDNDEETTGDEDQDPDMLETTLSRARFMALCKSHRQKKASKPKESEF